MLLDRDRIDQDVKAGRDAAAVASRWKIEIMHLDPNLEGCCSDCIQDRNDGASSRATR